MRNLLGFVKRFSGPNRIAWTAADLEKLRLHYGLTEKEAAEIVRARRPALCTPLKDDAKKNDDLPLKWSFTASDGKVDRAGDIISVAGIDLGHFHKNPIWFFQHDYDQPIGKAPSTYKSGGKLKSVLELSVDIFPQAAPVQRALAAGVIRACSIGFDPIRWTFNKARDGVDFHEVSLREISAVTLPCAAGAVLDGPVKHLTDERRRAIRGAQMKRQATWLRLRATP